MLIKKFIDKLIENAIDTVDFIVDGIRYNVVDHAPSLF